jgi:cytidylate kinase
MNYRVIAIEREYASGGREIGQRLAGRLRLPCHGHDILEMAAEKTGFSQSELSKLEESMTGSFLYTLNLLADISSGKAADLTMTQKLALAESNIIRDLVLNPCVIIGRGAAGLLKDKTSALKVFIHADHDTRIKRAIDVYGIHQKEAEATLRRYDKRRSNYFVTTTGVEWKDENNYHLFLNSGKLDMDTIVELLYTAVG